MKIWPPRESFLENVALATMGTLMLLAVIVNALQGCPGACRP